MESGNPSSAEELRLYPDILLPKLGVETRVCPTGDETGAGGMGRNA